MESRSKIDVGVQERNRLILLQAELEDEHRAPVAHLVVHWAETREVVSSRLRPDQPSGSLNN